jgi:threonine dehydrogenase-like Zn-dependent dehydrogenase
MTKNLAAVIVKFGESPEIQEFAFPKMAPGSVIVRIDAATLCGTDVSRWKGKLPQGGADQPFLQPLDVPYIPGHETCGTIVEIAGEAYDILHDRLKVGDRIVSSYGHCGRCYYCRVARQTSFCNEVQTFGHSSPEKMIGGCAQYQYYPAEGSYIRAPEGLAPAVVASGTCALRTVMHAVELVGRIESHETVLVLGAGPLGLYSLAVAREQGALRTLLIGAPQNRLAVARRWGVDEVLDFDAVPDTSERISWVRDLTEGRGADVVINCGSSYALVEGLRMTRPGGRFVQIAGGAGKPIEVPPELLFRGVRTFFPVTAEARHFYQAMRFLDLKRDRYSFGDMISTAYTLEQTGSALAGMANYTEVKPVIYPNGLPLA